MPSIASRTIPMPEVQLMDKAGVSASLPPIYSPPINPVLRSPLPNIVAPSPDSLKQWGLGGIVPQYRFTPAKPLGPVQNNTATATSTTTTIIKQVSSGGSSGGGSGGSGVAQILAGSNVSISPVGGTGVVTINASGSGGGLDLTEIFLFMGA